MRYYSRSILSLFLALGLTGCAVSSQTLSFKFAPPELVSPSSSVTPSPLVVAKEETLPNTKIVKIYQVDTQCEKLVYNSEEFSVEGSLNKAIGEVIKNNNNGDFTVTGYRLYFHPKSNTLTVDLRLSPDTKRQFISLSSCEQLALFGSLKQTILGNDQWGIKKVQFTEKGQEIIF